jgi:hypothetical protein
MCATVRVMCLRCVCGSVHEVTFIEALPLSSNSSQGFSAAPPRRDRHLGVVNKHGSNSIIAIRVGAKNGAANLLPNYCDETCVSVRLL